MSGKIDITFSRSMGLQPRQFESIKPSVSITFKDVDAEKLQEKVSSMIDIVTECFNLEFASEIFQYNELKSVGFDNCFNDIINNLPTKLQEISENMKVVF